MPECKYCKDLNEEIETSFSPPEVVQIMMDGAYCNYEIPLVFCPACGERLKEAENASI